MCFFATHLLLKRWCSNWRSPTKVSSHVGHSYVLKWASICALRSSLVENFLTHISHEYCNSLSAWISRMTLEAVASVASVASTTSRMESFSSISSSFISLIYSVRSMSLATSRFGTAHTLSCLLTLNVNIWSGKWASHMTWCLVIPFTFRLTASHHAFRLTLNSHIEIN